MRIKTLVSQRSKLAFLLIGIACLSCNCGSSSDQGKEAVANTAVIATGLDTPWEIVWGPDNFLWITERAGTVSRIDPATGAKHVILTLPEVAETSESGLLGMVIHPDFTSNPYVYLAFDFMGSNDSLQAKLVRFTYVDSMLQSPVTLLDGIPAYQVHDGCRMLITPDLKLFMTLGDIRHSEWAQDTTRLNGKILRMNLDGSVPNDNPIPGSLLWTWGHRNPQGLALANGVLYEAEHGESSDDEVNIIDKGRNYGWPNVEGVCDRPDEKTFCSANDVKEPLHDFVKSVAPCGIAYYNGSTFSTLKNSILVAELRGEGIGVVKLDQSGQHESGFTLLYSGAFGRVRAICVSPAGRIFFSTSNKDGRGDPRPTDDRIVEIVP